ncbi:putative sulfate transporter 3.3 [Platanthera guangdongensis]|uniref:Sulfate transporter 3.3 n=1 Tax=Platanthera guangdongensis TaxID=2320717 RepID=A0ABR2LDI3_9ASPA
MDAVGHSNTGSPAAAVGGRSEVEIRMAPETVPRRVPLPPPQSTCSKLKRTMKEIFFSDDPFRRFHGKPLRTKWILGAQFLFPILDWGPAYNFSLFKSDIIAGITIASLAIPQGISYAGLANLPPIIGLYSSFVPPLVYTVLGSSKDLAVGPVSITSLIMGSMLRQVANPAKELDLFLRLAFTSTFFAGLFQAALGIFRLGFIIDYLSKATLVGFMAGAGIIVSLQQLKGLLGIVHFSKQMALVPVMSSVFHETHEWSWQTVLMGSCFLGILLLTRQISTRRPKLFWVSAGAPLASVILSTLLVYLFKAQNHGISIIGQLQRGLNSPSWDKLLFHGLYLATTVKVGIVTGIISLAEGVAVGRTFAAMKGYKVDGNKEMMAIGIMNIIGSCTSCYITTGSFSRSAVNHNAGGKTAMSNIVMSITVMVTLLFLMPLFVYTPNVVLAAIIITAVIGLIDINAAYHIWMMDKMDFLVCICAFFGVIFISVEEGLAIAVVLSILRILLQITRPKMVIQGNIPGTDIYRNLHYYKEATRVPGFLILEVEAPINFANVTNVNERISRWIEEEKEKHLCLQFLILDLSSVSATDTSGISFFMELKKLTEKEGLQLAFVNPVGEIMEKLQRANDLYNLFGPEYFYLTTGEAILSLSSLSKESRQCSKGTNGIYNL